MVAVTIDLGEDDFHWLTYRAEALGLPDVSALVRQWIAADATEGAKLETLRALIAAGECSGVSDRTLQAIYDDHRRGRATAA